MVLSSDTNSSICDLVYWTCQSLAHVVIGANFSTPDEPYLYSSRCILWTFAEGRGVAWRGVGPFLHWCNVLHVKGSRNVPEGSIWHLQVFEAQHKPTHNSVGLGKDSGRMRQENTTYCMLENGQPRTWFQYERTRASPCSSYSKEDRDMRISESPPCLE